MLHLNTKKIKSVIFTILMTVAFCQTNAQQPIATLNHNDTITVFYGDNSFKQAYNASVGGDIITLSSGFFNRLDSITKAVTIRGAGMFSDTLGNRATIIKATGGMIIVDIVNDTINHLVLEGVYVNNPMRIQTLYNPQFLKCRFQQSFGVISKMENAIFINCIANTIYTSHQSNTQFINSFINNLMDTIDIQNISLVNSIAALSYDYVSKFNVLNSIVINKSMYNGSYNAASSYNSIGISTSSRKYYFDTVNTPDHNLHNFNGYNYVFKYYNGTYTDEMSFELQDSVANNILGNDNTQIGIYGGLYPFNPNVHNPRIHRCNVAQRSTVDNKLSVDIEVVSDYD